MNQLTYKYLKQLFIFTTAIGMFYLTSSKPCLAVDGILSPDNSTALEYARTIAQTKNRLDDAVLQGDTLNSQKLAIKLTEVYFNLGLTRNASSILLDYDPVFQDFSNDTIQKQWLQLSAILLPDQPRLTAQKKLLLLAEKNKEYEEITRAYLLIINEFQNQHEYDKAQLYLQSYHSWQADNKPDKKLTHSMLPSELRLAISTDDSAQIDNISSIVVNQLLSAEKTVFKPVVLEIFLLDHLPKTLAAEIANYILLSGEEAYYTPAVLLKLFQDDSTLSKQLLPFKKSDQIGNWRHDIVAKQTLTDSIKYFLFNSDFLAAQKKISTAKKSGTTLIVFLWLFSLLTLALIIIIVRKLKSQKVNMVLASKTIDEQAEDTRVKIASLETDLDERVEDKIVLLQNELSEQKKLDQELRLAITKAEEANYLKNSFMSNMSHEIRTPLNGILGFATLLENELALLDNKELFDYANNIQQSGDKLLRLLNNIIDISRLQANDVVLKKEPINLEKLIFDVIEPLHYRTNDKGIKIVTQLVSSNDLLADFEMVKRIFHEILDNSIKFTDKGYIKVSSNPYPEENMIEIAINDTGIGIDATYLNTIFEPFRQESSGYSKQSQGAGLGLPLAKQMTQLMGGTFSIKSEKSIGTTVIITLPLSAPSEVSKVEPITSIPSLDRNLWQIKADKTFKVLIVEDEKTNMIVLTKFLEPYFTIDKAFDGEQAIKLLKLAEGKGANYHLMLFDINLPAPWDGIKLLQWIKEHFIQYRQIPFIAQTAYGMAGNREKFLSAGFDGYIAKPIKRDELMFTITEVMNAFDPAKKNI